MNFAGNIIDMGEIKISGVAEWVQSFPDWEWNRYTFREQGKTHRHTKSFFIHYFENGIKEHKPDFFKNFYLLVIKIQQKIFQHFVQDTTVTRIIVVNLHPNSSIPPHKDSGEHLERCIRCHIPIITNENVIFTVGNKSMNLKKGRVYAINNQLTHSVENNSNEIRTHLIMDFG